MDVSHETPEQTHQRLQIVIARADWHILDGTYTFEELASADVPRLVAPDALAFVRDDKVWSQLVPCADQERDLYTVFRFHFLDGLDNSGFVGWLASHLKTRLGTGVFVVCGQNSARGGIFDYWGCPAAVGDDVLTEIKRLRQQVGAT